MFQSHVMTNSAMKRLVFFVERGLMMPNSVLGLCLSLCQFFTSAVFIKFKSQIIITAPKSTLLKSNTFIENTKMP